MMIPASVTVGSDKMNAVFSVQPSKVKTTISKANETFYSSVKLSLNHLYKDVRQLEELMNFVLNKIKKKKQRRK